MEGSNTHIDKEPDGVIIYRNGANHDSSYSNSVNDDKMDADQTNALHLYELGHIGPQLDDVLDKSSEIKECKDEKLIESTKLCQVEHDEQNMPSFNTDIKCSEEYATPDSQMVAKSNEKTHGCGKKDSKYTSRSCKTKCTVPQPFALATEKRGSCGTLPCEVDLGNISSGEKLSPIRVFQHPTSAKHNLTSSPVVAGKPLQSDNNRQPVEDNCSVASRTMASARKVRTTVTSSPVFKSSERAERRKEYYSKLEERHQALEAEKSQYEAKTREEKEAALKQLRKSLLFKATPMPNFYNEGPPPKIELKKPPPTRARSPKLGRRKSCHDAKALDKGTQETRHGSITCKNSPPMGSTNRKFGVNIQNQTLHAKLENKHV